MKKSVPSRSGRFTRYAVASSTALGAAGAARAQFSGSFDVTPPTANSFPGSNALGSFGSWTGALVTGSSGGFSLNTSSAPTSISFSDTNVGFTGTASDFSFTHLAPSDGTVTVNVSSLGNAGGTAFYTTDYVTFNQITATGNLSFGVSNGATFGFKLSSGLSYTQNASLTLSSFSFAAIPEPGATGLLTGCAAAGFVGLMAVRTVRRRTTTKISA